MKYRLSIILLLFAALLTNASAPRYIFYLIGDGMGNGPVMSAQTYLRLTGKGDSLLNMLTLPVSSQATTWSANTPVTDSAAAGTALATGHKTNNSMIGMTPDSVAVTSVATRLHQAGFGVALVTTVAPDDATPAAFYAHVPHRKMFYQIGRQAAESGFEFFAGASLRGTTDKKTGKPTDLTAYIESHGISIVNGLAALDSVNSRRIILLEPSPYNNSNVGYTIDSIPGMLTLRQMTAAAIDHLNRVSPDRFFIMIEGGNIDHSLHSNDAMTSIAETLEFDAALAMVLDFYKSHPDETLIVVTADHDTGGMSVGNNHTGYNAYPSLLTGQRISKDKFSKLCNSMLKSRRIWTWDDMHQILQEKLGLYTVVQLSEEEDAMLREIFERVYVRREHNDQNTLYARINEFAAKAVDLLNKKAGFGWTSLHHTGNPVPVYAIGAGAELFGNWNDNTDLPVKILKAVDATEQPDL